MPAGAAGMVLASVETYLGRKVATRASSDALVRQLSLLFSIAADDAGPDDLRQFDDVFITLAEMVDSDTRGFLAVQLSISVNAPRGIVKRLAGDVIEVSRPILIHSPVLSNEDLIEVATRSGVAHMQAIAERNELAVEVSDILVMNGDDTVRRTVAGNHGAALSSKAFRRLSQQAVTDATLETAMASRSDTPEIIIRFLLRHGTGGMRTRRRSGTEAGATTDGGRPTEAWYGLYDFDAAEARVSALAEQGLRGEPLLMRFAAEECYPESVLVFSRLVGIRTGTVLGWMTMEKPDCFLTAARAIGLQVRTVFALLNIGPWRNVLDGARRQICIRRFQAMTASDAQEQLQNWRLHPATVR